MREQDLSLADDPEVTVIRPHFGEEEKSRARSVVPLNEGDASNAALNRGPLVVLRGPAWRPRHLIVALALGVTAAILTATALYQHFSRANPPAYTRPSTQVVEEPAPLPQSSAPPQPYRTRRAGVVYADRGDEEGNQDDDSDGETRRRKHRSREAKDDEKMVRRARKVERVRRELRRLRDIIEQ